MSDSSSVDRWHPSNVEWPEVKWIASAVNIESTTGPQKVYIHQTYRAEDGYLSGDMTQGCEAVPADAYEALYADRGRVLAAVEKRVEGLRLVPPNVGYGDGWQDYNSAIDDALNAIKSSSSSSTEERDI